MVESDTTYGKHWQPRPDRRRLLFWWPAAAIMAITALLCVAGWPRGAYRVPQPLRRPPEPSAAYVLVSANVQSLYLKADIIARPTMPGLGRSGGDGLADRETGPERTLPALSFLRDGGPKPRTPAALDLPVRLPGLAARPVAAPLWAAPAQTNGVVLRLSPALQQAGFTATVVRAHLPKEGGILKVWMELDDAGRVAHALGDTESGRPSKEALRALRLGSGTHAATGWVDLAWPAVKQ